MSARERSRLTGEIIPRCVCGKAVYSDGKCYRHYQEAGSRERLDAVSSAFLAFAAMMKEDYGISKEVAVLAIAAAYETNAEKK